MLPEVLTKRRPLRAPLPLEGDPGQLSQHRLKLTVVAGPDVGSLCDVLAARASIGTAGTNDLHLSDDTVSRHHCAAKRCAGVAKHWSVLIRNHCGTRFGTSLRSSHRSRNINFIG